MKKILLSLLTFCALTASAQNEIVVGDMNDDGQLTVGDVTALSETVVGRQAVRRISVAGDPYATDNTSIVGQWSGVSGTITFNADGTTDYKEGYSYEYLPAQCMVMFYDPSGAVVESLEVMKLSVSKLVLANVSLTEYFTYGEHVYFAEDGSIYHGAANGHRYVDLGLPSGTLWATCNVGADSPEEYGEYFAWGETIAKDTKDSYNWKNYKYCNGKYNTMTKYNNDSKNGIVDNIAELEPEDDAATANWGSGWQTPSNAQIEELMNTSYTTTTWASQNGVNGRKITSKLNGASIFLPAAGYVGLYGYSGSGVWGDYWSRSLDLSEALRGHTLYIEDSIVRSGLKNNPRYFAQTVRPVRM